MTDTEGLVPRDSRPEADAEPVPAPVEEPTPSDEPEPTPEPVSEASRARRPWIVASAVLLVLATFFGVLAARYRSQLSDEQAERDQVQAIAGRFATAFVTYDYRNLDASLERIKADATSKFANEYERLFQTSVKTLITETQAQSKGAVTDVFLGPVEDEAATVLTVVNVERQGKGGKVPVAGTYLELDMVKVSGRWRVDNVTAINFTQSAGPAPGGGGSAPAPPTTTTVPE